MIFRGRFSIAVSVQRSALSLSRISHQLSAATTELHALSSLMIRTSNRSMCRSLSSVSPSTPLMDSVCQLSALEKEKSSSILLFERRKEEKEDFACSERDEFPIKSYIAPRGAVFEREACYKQTRPSIRNLTAIAWIRLDEKLYRFQF